ncbi:unnamed protein product (macronuclear) [Paramecium tetraurelia]|uniref:SIMPL domain-containing protein n=1 Tax=Paramecium tetraurelia TaxID=5888 RepID=A0D490_PARTE|nr:uncharacterized protein GSPATT00013323001 [Paramecium tetraurelia]CAK77857.1 unnamed protein product [Paramecium tetraurelia]|eukprot:XP_001445254.1 hypothetical protein (macronuclear) [Paramecium tetraurelia strain d4-2]
MILLLFFISAVLSNSIDPIKLDQTEMFPDQKLHHHKNEFKIKVTGSGIVELQPTIGTVIFPIESRDKQADNALYLANSLVFTAAETIKWIFSDPRSFLDPKEEQSLNGSMKLGIESVFFERFSIETGKQQISLIYDNKTQVEEYLVTNYLYITTKHIDMINKIIVECVNSGLNRGAGVNYSNSQKEVDKAKDKAFKLAIKDAKRKAKNIARLLNLEVHEYLNFKYLDSENNSATGQCDPKAAEILNQATCIPNQSAKKYFRVDVELSVLLK